MISSIFQWYRRLPLVAQRLILRSLFSTVVLSIWTHVATHFYALRYGARLPLEGVPFLTVFAAFAAIILAFVSVSTLALVPFAKDAENAKTPTQATGDENPDEEESDQNTRSSREIGSRSFFASIWSFSSMLAISGLSLSALSLLYELKAFGLIALIGNGMNFGIGSSLLFISAFMGAVMAGSLATGRLFRKATKRQIEILSLGMYLVAGTTVLIAMLGPAFDHLLRTTQYGGGIVVNIETRDDGLIQDVSLFLVSEDTVTIWDSEGGVFQEYNSMHVIAITYDQDQTWRMPKSRPIDKIVGLGHQRIE